MADEPSGEFEEFVEGLVPLDEAQGQQDHTGRSPFESLLDALTGGPGRGFEVSLVTGAGLLLGAAALTALLPSEDTSQDSFWRVGRGAVADVLALGNGLAIPLAVGALALLVVAVVAALRGGEMGSGLVAVQPFVGGAGLVGAGGIWAAFLGLAVVNAIVLLLIIVAYIVAGILMIALFLGFLAGLVNQ